jgi:hypothetical protein
VHSNLCASSVCPCCSAPIDRWRDHALRCRVGRGVAVTHRHVSTRDTLFRLVGGWARCGAGTPLSGPCQGWKAGGQTFGLGIWGEGRDLYVDVVESSSIASSNVQAFAPGAAALHRIRAVACNCLQGGVLARDFICSFKEALINQSIIEPRGPISS